MSAPSDPSVRRPSFARRHWGKLLVAAVILVPALVFTVWSAAALSFAFSEGTRTGFALKLSRRGWICKTWEGELAVGAIPGQMPQVFRYTVREDSVAREIQRFEGQQVALSYRQHVNLPTRCFGETEYFVNGVRPIGVPVAAPAPAATPAAPAVAPAAPPPAAPPAAAPATTAPASPTPAGASAGATQGATPAPPPATPPAPPPATPPAPAAQPATRPPL